MTPRGGRWRSSCAAGGGPSTPSPPVSTQVVDSIARLLKLSAEEHRYFELLATGKSGHRVIAAAPEVRRALDDVARAVRGAPLYVADRRGDLVAWNREATEWFTEFGLLPEPERNMVRWMLIGPWVRQWWEDQDARPMTPRLRRLRHPVRGVCLMRIVVSFVAGAEDLGVVMHVPATEDANGVLVG